MRRVVYLCGLFGLCALGLACSSSGAFQPGGGGNGGGGGGGGGGGDAGRLDGEPIDAPGSGSGSGSGAAPTITVVNPPVGELVSGTIQLDYEVTAPDGVMSVTATVAEATTVTLTANGSDFTGSFDTTTLANLVAPDIVVRAESVNQLETELGYEIILDNKPPLASLDPPEVRVAQLDPNSPSGLDCSQQFAPLGNSPVDGDRVFQLVQFRARVEDQSNTGLADTTVFIPRAGVANAQLYVLSDATVPLVVDSTGSGVCDAINPNVIPAVVPSLPNEAAVVTLAPVTPTGAGFFPSGLSFGNHANECSSGSATTPPAPVCTAVPVTDVIAESLTASVPEVYAIPPADQFNCMGFAMDMKASNIQFGWACVAILTSDNLGNTSVSAPIRVCVDPNGTGSNCGAEPTCTGTLTGSGVTSTACTPNTFDTKDRTGGNDFEVLLPPPG